MVNNLVGIVKKYLKTDIDRDIDGKPVLYLIPLERTAVNTSTKKKYDEMMRIYECGGWKSRGKVNPTQINKWNNFKKKMSVETGVDYITTLPREFGFANIGFYKKHGYKVISPKDFYKIQEVTPHVRRETNKWFNKNDK